jgi:hypothetical protein
MEWHCHDIDGDTCIVFEMWRFWHRRLSRARRPWLTVGSDFFRISRFVMHPVDGELSDSSYCRCPSDEDENLAKNMRPANEFSSKNIPNFALPFF